MDFVSSKGRGVRPERRDPQLVISVLAADHQMILFTKDFEII